MEDEEVERILQESADKIQIMDFSERWKRIQSKLAAREVATQKEPVPEAVLANSANESVPANGGKRKIAYILCALFLAMVVCLAIVLPIVLKSNKEPTYFDFIELSSLTVSETEFYDKLNESELNTVDFAKFEANKFDLLYTPNNDLAGGRLEFSDEENSVFTTVVFCKSSITSNFEVGEEYTALSVNGATVKYSSEFSEDYYTIKAKAEKANINYKFDCLALEANIDAFFQKVFG